MNLLKAASTVSLLTLASRITGLAREWVIAAGFGASAWTDAFNVAFRIPNLLRRLFAEGAFSQAFVPLLAATRQEQGDEATHHLINAVATVLAWALLLTCVAGVLAAPVLVWLMASGLERFDDAVIMTRIMFPYIGFMSMVALAAGILNTWRHFTAPAATPVLLNLAVIAAAVALSPVLEQQGIAPVYALAVGVMAGGVLQLVVQLPVLARVGMLPRIGCTLASLSQAWKHPGVLRVLRQMVPALLGVSVAQLSLLINTQIASHQGQGAVSWLSYADRLMEFPTALLGVALGVVLLPQLSAAQARGEQQEYSALLDWGLRLVLLMALPCAMALLLFARPLVAVLYHYGAFSDADVQQTSVALMGYGVGLLGLVAVKVLAPGFYARQDIRTPVRIAVWVLVLTQLMNLIWVPVFHHAGLALSIGMGALLNAAWLLWGLRAQGVYQPAPGWPLFALRVTVASAVLGAALLAMSSQIDWMGMQARWPSRVALMAGSVLASAGLYFALLSLMGLRLRSVLRKA